MMQLMHLHPLLTTTPPQVAKLELGKLVPDASISAVALILQDASGLLLLACGTKPRDLRGQMGAGG
jgi:hypothetical protein